MALINHNLCSTKNGFQSRGGHVSGSRVVSFAEPLAWTKATPNVHASTVDSVPLDYMLHVQAKQEMSEGQHIGGLGCDPPG